MGTERPLSGIRIIDFGQYVAGPAAAMMLGDLGAEVIHIDPPGGPLWDSPAAAMLNRGKICITLDLKSAEGLAEARRLVASADGVIENFRPGVMARLGLDPAVLQAAHPALVTLSLPAFAAGDEARAGLPGWEAMIAAACGQYSDMGLNRILMGIEPSFSPLTLASAYGAVLGASAMTLALQKRALTGLGDVIEVPLAAALMEGLAYNSQNVEDYPERYKSNREKEIDRRRAGELAMDAEYADLQELLDPFYRNYQCADGRQVYVVSASHNRHPERVLRILGLWDQLQAEGLPNHDAYLDVADWPDDCSLSSYPLSQSWADRVSGLMKEAFLSKTSFEWERIFGEGAAPAAAQRTTKEWLASDHAQASGLILKVLDPDHGPMLQLGNLAWLLSDAERAATPAPRRVVAAADIPDHQRLPLPEPQKALHGEGWLAGIKILDLTNVIAGPTIASTLARFGAEIISIDPVTPSMDPWNGIIFGMHAGRGKRSVLLDLKTEKGRAVLDRILQDVDIVTANATDKQLASIGLDPARLKALNPKLILCQLDCYGGPRIGPRSNYPGYDDLAQASTGVMARFGGSLDTPEEHAHFGTIDVLGGFCGALAIGAALVQRARTGAGDVARASLCAAGQLIQAPFMYDCADRGPFDEPSDRHAKGWGPFYRAYAAADQWFFLAMRASDCDTLCSLDGIPPLADLTEQEQERALEAAFRLRPAEEWIKALLARDLGGQLLSKMNDVRDAHKIAEGDGMPDLYGPTFAFIRHAPHPSGRWVDLVAPNAIRPRHAGLTIPGPMPKPGSHTREVLSAYGVGEADQTDMLAEGMIAESWSKRYLPV